MFIPAQCAGGHFAKASILLLFGVGIRLKLDNVASVMYAEVLNSAKSSGTLQSTDRHEILGQKPPDFQLSL